MRTKWMRGLAVMLPLLVVGPALAENPKDRVSADAINRDRSLPHNSAGDIVMGPSRIGSSLQPGDVAFIGRASLDGLAAYRLGELASAQGSTAAVRQLGQQIMADHQAGYHELKSMAESKGAIPPSSLPRARAENIDALEQLHGAAFDRAVLGRLSGELQQSLQTYAQQTNLGADGDLRQLSAKRLPIVRQEYNRAQGLLEGGA